jgi:glyoxylase-like metal-dependent hydrolase (beta-lactamase superfamily II)
VTGPWLELADGVYQCSFESWNLNVGLVVGDERALVIDTRATPREGRELRESVRRVTTRELVVVNTHAHLDHCLGNGAFSGARMLAHPAAIAALRSPPPDWNLDDETAPTVPGEAVGRSAILDLGGRSVLVHHPGRGHTDGDLVVRAQGTGVAFAGDLIRQDGAPWYGDGHPLQWPATLRTLPRAEATTWVPGHGRPMGDDEVRAQSEFLDDIARTITDCWDSGVPVAEAVSLLPLTPTNAGHAATRGYRALDATATGGESEARRPAG